MNQDITHRIVTITIKQNPILNFMTNSYKKKYIYFVYMYRMDFFFLFQRVKEEEEEVERGKEGIMRVK